MSIQLSGPKGYEYQYRVTVLNALFLRNNSTKMYVEKIGSEDALIEIENEDSTKQFIEIQVKREEGILGIPQLIKWLCHFEERTSNNNLLQKLIDNENTKVIFVTRSRCSDSIVFLKKDYNKINDSAAVLTSKELSSFFLKELKKIKIGDTDLNKKREQFCYNQALKLNHKMVKDLLEKCIIVEEFTDEKVDTAVLQYLNSKCQITQSKTEEIYLKLIQVVLGGRDEGFDISKRIKELLELNKIGNPFVDPLYKTRNEEKSLLLKLEKDHVLLLTGTSLCGKTELAKKISESFVLKGYNYFIHDEIYNIKKFLQTNILDNKIVILSDPFGHVELKDKFTEILKSIKELLDIKEKHHLLIITSRIELLFDVYNTKTIEECSIGKMQWFDLTLHDIETLLPFWEFISKENSLTKNIFETVEKGIIESQNESQLQIGQLRYLASEDIEKLEGKNFNELVHIAKSNSREIANQLETSNSSSAQLLSILSVSSSSVYGVDFKDLAYIYSSDTELPSSLGEDVYIHSLDENESDFPSYSENFTPSIQLKKDLGYLEKRNLISIKKQIVITTHSNFLSAGLNLFLDKSTIYLEEKLDLYKKSIFCLNEQTAFIASRNLFFIYNQINPEFRSQVIELGFKALNSIFPAVEDNSLLFLTKIIGDLNIEQQEKIIFKIQKGGTDYYDIEWYNNQIPFKTNGGAGMKNLSLSLDKSKVSEVENKLKQKEFPSSYEIWGYIKTQKGKNAIDKEIFVILLQVKEAFIRSEIIYEIFRNQNILDEKFIEFLFKDEHPTVIFNLISAVIQNWFNFSEELKVICNSLIVKSLNRTDVAIRAYEVIATFSIDYGSESIIKWKKFNQKQIVELWNLWGVIYPQIINNIPLKIYLNGARFSSTMSTATKYIDIKIGMEVLNAWYKRIDFQISKNKIIDEYEMSIMEDLLVLTKNNSEIRKNLFSNLINYYDTSFLLSNLKWVLNNWEYIVQLEKEQIFTILEGNRMDLRWIKAVILTTENPPKELTEKILRNIDLFNEDVTVFLSNVNDSLLCDCLNVFCGFPQPLWWLALHHKNRNFWFEIMYKILLNENNVGFKICLENFIGNGVIGFTQEWKEWETLWDIICNNSSEKEYLFERLLYNTANATCNLASAKKMWTKLIETFDSHNQSNIIDCLILENLEILQQTGHGNEDVFKIFEEQFLFKRIIPKISPDNVIRQIIDLIQRDQYNDMAFNFFEKITEEHNTRFLGTLTYAKNVLDLQKEENQKVIETIKKMNNKIYDSGRIQMKQMNIFNYKLDNWIGIN